MPRLEFTMGGGIAPTIGASNFGHERYVLEVKMKLGKLHGTCQDKAGN